MNGTSRTASLRLQLIDQMSGPAKAGARNLRGLESDLKKFGKAGMPGASRLVGSLDHLKKKLGEVSRFSALRQDMARTFGDFRSARARVQKLGLAMAKVSEPTRKMQSEMRSAQAALQRTTNAFQQQRAAAQQAGQALRLYGLNTSRDISRSQASIRNQMAQTIRQMRQQRQMLEAEAKRQRQVSERRVPGSEGRYETMNNILSFGSGIYMGGRQLAAPIGKAMGYDETLTRVAATMASGKSIDDKRAAKRRISDAVDSALKQGGGSRESAASALNTLVSSGAFEGDEALEALKSVTKTAHAAGADPEDIAKMAIAMRNNGILPKDLMAGFDVAHKAGALGGVELKDMAKWFPQQMAMARGSGLTGMDSLRFLAAANQVSLRTAGSPDEAANNIVNLLQKLSSRELQSTMGKEVKVREGDPTKGKGKKSGFDFTGYLLKRQKEGVSAPEAFADLLDRQLEDNKQYQDIKKEMANASTPEDRKALLEQATNIAEASSIGQIIADRQALMAALALLQGKGDLKKMDGELRNAGGSVEADSRFVREQGWSKTQDLKNTADRANEQAYDALSGPLGTLTGAVNEAAAAFPGLTAGLYSIGTIAEAIGVGGVVGGGVGGLLARGAGGAAATGAGAVATSGAAVTGGAAAATKMIPQALVAGFAAWAAAKAERMLEEQSPTIKTLNRAIPNPNQAGLWVNEQIRNTDWRRFFLGRYAEEGTSFRQHMRGGAAKKEKDAAESNLSMQTVSWPVQAQAGIAGYVQALAAGGSEAEAKAAAIGEQIKADLSVQGNPTVNTGELERALIIARQVADAIRGMNGQAPTVPSSGGSGASPAPVKVDGARASGGPVTGGKSYLVGEEGPEVIVPGKSGTVIPNGGTWGGNTVSITLGGPTIIMNGSSGNDAEAARRIQAVVDRSLQNAMATLDQQLQRSTDLTFGGLKWGDA